MEDTTPSIYVACLASYNNGYLHGEWIDATQDLDVVLDEINSILKSSPAKDSEEYAIHDHDNFCGYEIDEYAYINNVVTIAKIIEEHQELAVGIVSYAGIDFQDVSEFIENNLAAEDCSESDFAYDLFNDLYLDSIPDYCRSYIDYDAFERDLFISDYFSFEANNKKYIFHNQ